MTSEPIVCDPIHVQLSSSPFPNEWVLDGTPHASGKVIARSADHAMAVVVWSCTPGRFEWHYETDEVAHFLAGEVFIGEGGAERRLTAGDTAVFVAGSKCIWRVTQEVRKVAVCRLPVPKLVGFGLRVWNYGRRMLRRQSAPAMSSMCQEHKGVGAEPSSAAQAR